MLSKCILRARKHNRALVHQHNMEMNIPLAAETNLWACTPMTALQNVPQPSQMLGGQCARYRVWGQSAFFFRGLNDQWSKNQTLVHRHSNLNNRTNKPDEYRQSTTASQRAAGRVCWSASVAPGLSWKQTQTRFWAQPFASRLHHSQTTKYIHICEDVSAWLQQSVFFSLVSCRWIKTFLCASLSSVLAQFFPVLSSDVDQFRTDGQPTSLSLLYCPKLGTWPLTCWPGCQDQQPGQPERSSVGLTACPLNTDHSVSQGSSRLQSSSVSTVFPPLFGLAGMVQKWIKSMFLRAVFGSCSFSWPCPSVSCHSMSLFCPCFHAQSDPFFTFFFLPL